jgi:CBS domain-containing protein
LLGLIIDSHHGDLLVINDSEELVGIISLREVRQAIADRTIMDLLIASDLMTPVASVNRDDSVSTALQRIKKHGGDCIAVVASEESRKIVGILTMNDIISSYSTLLEEWETSQFLLDYSQKKTMGSERLR